MITPYALDQMAEIRDYTAYELLNPDEARNLIQRIRTEVMGLRHMPERFRTIEEEPWGGRGIRKLIALCKVSTVWAGTVKKFWSNAGC